MEYEPKQAVNVPLADFMELEFHLMDTRPGVKPEEFITELIKRWLKADMDRLALRRTGHPQHGFQWKNVFLPEGTSLRTSHGGIVEFAKVVRDGIVADDGAALTPSLFANRHAKGRNAWRFVWLRLPGDEHWLRAGDYRAQVVERLRNQSRIEAAVSKTA